MEAADSIGSFAIADSIGSFAIGVGARRRHAQARSRGTAENLRACVPIT